MTDLIQDFIAETECLGVDPEFRRWGGIVLVSSLMSRDCWTSISAGMPLYGNLYVGFVGDSGFGKSLVINAVGLALQHITRRPTPVRRVVIVPQDCTLEELVLQLITHFPHDEMQDGQTRALVMLADEIGVLFREDANKKDLSLLQSIYDMRFEIARRRVGDRQRNQEFQGFNHYLTALWGMTPAWLETGLPASNIGLGWPARTHFVMGHQLRKVTLFGERSDLGARLGERLGAKMDAVTSMARGLWLWSEDAVKAINEWLDKGLPGFDHASDLLNGYANRRLEHAAKLSLIYAVARHPANPVIQLADFQSARAAMLGVERDLPELFSRVGASNTRFGEQRLIDWAAGQKGNWFTESELRNATREFFSPREHDAAIDALLAAKVFEAESLVTKPHRVLRLK